MTRKTTYIVQFKLESSEKFCNLCTSESAGTAHLIAKLWADHIERTDPQQTGSKLQVIEERFGKLIWRIAVNPTNETCAHKDHRRKDTQPTI